MDVTVITLAQHPELVNHRWIPHTWPEFIRHDPIGEAYFGRLAETFPDLTLLAVDPGGRVVARGHTVPFALHTPERGGLPATGWDQVLIWGFSDHHHEVEPDTVSAIDITVRADCLGQGLSSVMLDAMRKTVRARGFTELVAPVRPTAKHREPRTAMAEYAVRTREDGLPVDPWLRTHVRAGGAIDTVAPASMVVTGSLSQWRRWTGAPFATEGWVDVLGGLTPVRCVPEHDYAVYVEPNVWVRHPLR